MDTIQDDSYLKKPEGAVENIRKIHKLDKPERMEEAVNILFEWIQKQDHIVKKDFSNGYLDRTLITCKGSVEKAKKQIDRLCTMKTLMPKFFTMTNARMELQKVLGFTGVPLPKLTEDYYRIVITDIRNLKNLTSDMFLQYYQLNLILAEYIIANDYANGFILIVDYRGVNLLDLVGKMNTMELQQFMSILIEGFGARVKAMHYLTDSKTIELLVKIMKQFLSDKIANRIFVQKSLEDLQKVVPKEYLPEEYGGNEKSITKLHAEVIDMLSSEKHVEYMKMMNKACSDETKRHAGKFNEEYMGMPGAFRNLSVD